MKCAHPPCTCLVTEAGGFCDQACMAASGAGGACLCGHPVCEAAPAGDVEPPPFT
jgi:hypothetical protein